MNTLPEFSDSASIPESAPLAVRFGHLGDVLLTTGVLAYYGKKRGQRFDVLTRKVWAPVFEGHPFVRNVHTLPDDLGTPGELRFFRSLAKCYKGVPLLDLHGNLRSHLLRAVWKGPVRAYDKLGFARRLFAASKGRLCGDLLRERNVPQRYCAAFAEKAPPAAKVVPVMYLNQEEIVWARQVLLDKGIISPDGGMPVALHPFASHAPKTWPVASWRRLGRLLEEQGTAWIAVGSGEDIFGGGKNSFINRTSLRQSAALLAASRVLVTGDSGPMHLAGAVGTPVVALFGPTTREWGFYPAGKYDTVLESDASCRPCSLHGKSACALPCLERIAPEAVALLVREKREDRDGF